MLPLTDLDCANLCEMQYGADFNEFFDWTATTFGVTWSIKKYPDFCAVVFEGSHNLPDWMSNFKAIMIQIPDLGGVEQGFYDGLPQTMEQINPLLPKDKLIYVTGHSRGAAHAQIFAAMLIKKGYKVEVVTFGCPRPGDENLAKVLSTMPNRSYRNFHDFDEQDFVCDVPLGIIVLAPFIHPSSQITIDVAPANGDPWLLLARHHLQLYIEGLKTENKE